MGIVLFINGLKLLKRVLVLWWFRVIGEHCQAVIPHFASGMAFFHSGQRNKLWYCWNRKPKSVMKKSVFVLVIVAAIIVVDSKLKFFQSDRLQVF